MTRTITVALRRRTAFAVARVERALLGMLTIAGPLVLACTDRVTDPADGRAVVPSVGRMARSFPTELATVRWQAQARVLVTTHLMVTPPVATRMYALLAIAQFGAVVDADRDESDDATVADNGFGDGGRHQFESRRGAVAGASARVLSFLFPDAAATLELRLSDEANAGPGDVHPAFARGVALGRAFGDVLIERSKTDGFARPWPGTVPVGPGLWRAAPGAPLAGPQYSAMTPYFLTSPGQFHPAPPPAFGSPAFLADLAEVSTISLTRTPAQLAVANFWNLQPSTSSVVGYWDILASQYIDERGLDERAAAHVFALTNAAALDAVIGCWEAKYSYFTIRPSQASASITLPIGLPNHPSYPSGHSCMSAAPVEVLSTFFPEHAATLSAKLEEAGLSRIYAGLHYRFDITAGQILGRAVGRWAVAYDRENGLLSAVR